MAIACELLSRIFPMWIWIRVAHPSSSWGFCSKHGGSWGNNGGSCWWISKGRHRLGMAGGVLKCGIVIPAPSQKPWEPWGTGSFHLLILWPWWPPSSCVCAASVFAHLLPSDSASCCCHWWKSLSVGSSYGTTRTHSDGFYREGSATPPHPGKSYHFHC